LNTLAIDTSTENLIIGLKSDKKYALFSFNAGYKHGEILAPWIKKLCNELHIKIKRLNLIVTSIGPGSFTGLRIGLATAKGLSIGANCPIVGVSTLDVLAYEFIFCSDIVIPVLDAKKKQIYCALYQEGKRLSDYFDIKPVALLDVINIKKNIILTGPFAPEIYDFLKLKLGCKKIILNPNYSFINPYTLLELGIKLYKKGGDQSRVIAPLYLRKSQAEIKNIP
jgi:tRNA threonylcarbamoyladenosine biosynthesis protein TsaB